MDKVLKNISKLLSDSESEVSGNETFEIVKALYPGINAENTYCKIKKEMERFCSIIKIARLVDAYKKNQDYIMKNSVPTKLILLLTAADENDSFSEFNSSVERFNEIKKEQERISTQLVDLGFNKFNILECESSMSIYKDKLLPRQNSDDKTYYTKLFSLSDDFVELMTLYCINTPYKEGMKQAKLQLIHKLLLQKTKATPNSYDWFFQRIKKRYQALGLSTITSKGGL